jgi:hypothetical protein
VQSGVAIGVGVLALVVAGPFCVVPFLGLIAVPICIVGEALLVAGLSLRTAGSLRLVLLSSALGAALAVASVVTWVAPELWLAAPLVAAAPGLASGTGRATLLVVLGVVLAVAGLLVGLDVASSLLLAAHRSVPAPAAWPRGAALTLAATVGAFAASWAGLRKEERRARVGLALLVASVPVAGTALLVLLARAFDVPLSA